MTAADVKTRVAAALAELADAGSPDAIADVLRAKEIKGLQNDEDACPIALYLALIDLSWWPSVLEMFVEIDHDALMPPLRIDLPEPVSQFIRNFDHGVYLDLVEVAS